jgi:hypothetical protein
MPAETVELPDGLWPANVVNDPSSLTTAQYEPPPRSKTCRWRLIVSFAHALPPTPLS